MEIVKRSPEEIKSLQKSCKMTSEKAITQLHKTRLLLEGFSLKDLTSAALQGNLIKIFNLFIYKKTVFLPNVRSANSS